MRRYKGRAVGVWRAFLGGVGIVLDWCFEGLPPPDVFLFDGGLVRLRQVRFAHVSCV